MGICNLHNFEGEFLEEMLCRRVLNIIYPQGAVSRDRQDGCGASFELHKWMEEARVDFLDQIGYGYVKLEDDGIISPVLSVECE